jgi:hypothetical protein
MARHRTRVRVSRSLRAVAVGLLAAGTATALFEADIGRALLLSSSTVAGAPPMLYLLLAFVLLRGAPFGRRLGWAVAACGIYAGLGIASGLTLSLTHPMSLEGALRRSLWSFAPAPFIHLLAAPLVLLAWRPRLVPVRITARAEREPVALVARVPAPPLPASTPDWDSVLRVRPSAQGTSGPGTVMSERAGREREVPPMDHPREPTPAAAPAPAPAVAVAAPPVLVTPPPRAVATLPPSPMVAAPAPPPMQQPAPSALEPTVRVAFDRIADQLPPDVFVLPPARLAESLPEPHVLLVPRRLVLPQLGEGAVEIPWTLVDGQFPELAFSMPQAEVRRRFPGWVISLPMDEVVRQIPSEMYRTQAPAADLSDIGEFPAPFKPGPPEPEEAAVPEMPAPVEPAVAAQFVPAVEPPASLPVVAAVEAAPIIPEVLFVPETPPVRVAPPVPTPPPVPAAKPVPAVAAAPARPAIPIAAPPPVPVAPTPVPAVSNDESEAIGRALALGLAPLGAFDWRARRVGGRPLVSFVPPALTREGIDALAAGAVPLVERLASWGVEQVTIRTTRLVCVLTPLGARGCLAAAVRRGAAVAMLELMSARAARATGDVASTTSPAIAFHAVPTAPAGNGNSHRGVGEAARALAAFGPVASSVAEAEGAAPSVYVFAGQDQAVLAGAARVVHDALMTGHNENALGRLESVVLRRGRQRAIVRPLRGSAGAPAVLAAAGEVTLAGRAHRAAAQAAALLEAR